MPNFTDLLTPDNSQVIFIDQQPQMAFGVQSIDRQTLKNNVVALAKAAKIFNVPATITTVETESFSGHTYPELLAVYPTHKILERTSMNSWDDQNVRDMAVEDKGLGHSVNAFGSSQLGRQKMSAGDLCNDDCIHRFLREHILQIVIEMGIP